MILQDAALTAQWKTELEEVRLNMLTLRQSLADHLRRETDKWAEVVKAAGARIE